jgi:hypothetical protein
MLVKYCQRGEKQINLQKQIDKTLIPELLAAKSWLAFPSVRTWSECTILPMAVI